MSSQMVLKRIYEGKTTEISFRSMSSQMVLKLCSFTTVSQTCFRSMSSQMVLKHNWGTKWNAYVLDLCHLKWY